MTIQYSKPELNRLLREDPWDATALAQELFAFLPELITDIQANNTTQLQSGPGLPSPIQQTDTGTGDIPFVTIKRGTDPPINISIDPNTGMFNGIQPPQAVSTVFPGFVSSYIGGNQYTVTIYTQGISNPGNDVVVTQLEGDPAFPHAVGRAAMVVFAGGEYTMNIPVWG